MLYHTTWLISKLDPLKYMMESTALNGRMARWQILLSEFDIVYMSQKVVKWSTIADFLVSRALEDYEPLNFDFPNEDLMYVAAVKEDTLENYLWKLNFDGASNAVAMEREIKALEVYRDSALVIHQLKGEWETRDPKLINYRGIVMGLIEEFNYITFSYLPREENQMADALASLASMIKISKQEDMKPIQMSIYEVPTHCYNVDEGERDDYPWYQDILRYMRNRKYPEQATENDKKTLRRLACDYVIYGEILYQRRKDQVLLRCVDAVEAKKILEEVHEGVYGTHANGFTMARQIMRFRYYWSTMEGDCINYAKTCHKCQIYRDKIHFIFVVIDYFTKCVEAASYASVTKSAVSRFLKKEIICRYGMPKRIISDNTLNLNNSMIAELKLDEAEWIQSQYDQLNLIEEKRLRAIRHGQMYQKRMMQAYDKKVRLREFHEGDLVLKKILPMQKDFRGKWMPNWEGPYVAKKAFSEGELILAEMDGKNLPNHINSD
ncbi:Gypsy retrotransposon integrase-like protein 1 [Gossypium australe]|uniref:Gypsy retrotransposon integrase-like protein 1 n=1 Tax=Gossypium australe TaxID=47621 RepID=A0A5B6VAL0_9ROSI|nr:Gypsy retrotransposon integrase-like protein 1 [Gossypium australe]